MNSTFHSTPAAVIAIDGPAASGKSTVGEALARRLGFLYFDTGAMYRAITQAAIGRQIPIDDEVKITALAEAIDIDILPPTVEDGRQYTVQVAGEDITWEIRSPEVVAHVSTVAAYPGVRRAMVRQQRRIALTGRVVMVGRDIGTVVFPEAPLKVFLTASAEERARRRYVELLSRNEEAEYEAILEGVRRRDAIDSERAASPLRPADDAILLDTGPMRIEEVVDAIADLAQRRLPAESLPHPNHEVIPL